MKKLVVLSTIILVAVMVTGCKDPEVPHYHTFADKWTTSATHHWKDATCEHSETVSDFGEHSFGDWIVVKEPTEETEGRKERSCEVCGYKKETEIIDKLEHIHTMNIFVVKVIEKAGKIVVDEGSFEITPTDDQAKKLKDYIGKEVYFGILPEDLIYQKSPAAHNNLQMKVLEIKRFEADIHVYLSTKSQLCVALIGPDIKLQIGDTATFTPIVENVKFFDKETGLELTICEDEADDLVDEDKIYK